MRCRVEMQKMLAVATIGIAYASMAPTAALAEVMDKEPSSGEIWIFTAMFLVADLLLVRWRLWLPLVIWPVTAIYAVGFWEELVDPYVGPAIRIEAGWLYVILGYVAVAINVVAPIAIIIWTRWILIYQRSSEAR